MNNQKLNTPKDKEEPDMNAYAQEYPRLDLSKLRKRTSKTISTEYALQDVTPMDWSEDVLLGQKKIHITKTEKSNK